MLIRYIRSHMFSHYCKWLLKAHHCKVGEEHEGFCVPGIRWEVGLQLQYLKCPQEGAHIVWHNRWGETKLEDCSSKANLSMWISTLVVFFFTFIALFLSRVTSECLLPPRSSPEKGGAYRRLHGEPVPHIVCDWRDYCTTPSSALGWLISTSPGAALSGRITGGVCWVWPLLLHHTSGEGKEEDFMMESCLAKTFQSGFSKFIQ